MTKRALLLTLSLAFAGVSPSEAQSSSRLELLPESKVWVEGTSTRDDWTATAADVTGHVTLRAATGTLQVDEGGFELPSQKLQGGRSAIMDRLMHGALKASDHPTIAYRFVSGTSTTEDGGRYKIATNGLLTLAGVTKEVEGTVVAERLPDGKIRFTGSYPMLMSDFEITPPTALLGALRTGDRVVVHFELLAGP